MKTKIFTPRFIYITTTVLVAAASRLLPHLPNFTPVAAMALFGGVYFLEKKWAFIIPLIAMFLSDMAMELFYGSGIHSTMIYVYFGFILTTLIGIFIRNNVQIKTILTGSLLSSILFFLITNFGYWASLGFPMGYTGLTSAYIQGIPFFRYTLLGDLFFNIILFGSFYFAQIKFPVLARI